MQAAEVYHVQSRLACRVGRRVLQRDRRGESGDSAENFTHAELRATEQRMDAERLRTRPG